MGFIVVEKYGMINRLKVVNEIYIIILTNSDNIAFIIRSMMHRSMPNVPRIKYYAIPGITIV